MLEAFPRNGEDVAWDLQDTSFEPSLKDFRLYRSHMEEKKVDWGDALIGGAGEIAKRVGKGILGLAEFESAAQVPGTAVEGVAAGTYSLYGVLAQSDNPASSLFKFKDWISGTGTDRGQYGQFLEARKVWKNIREAEEGGESISGIDPAYVNQDVRNALELVADPSVFIPFAGGPKAAALAARAAGRVGHAAGTGVRAVGRAGTAVGAVPEFATTLGARAIGAPAEAAARAGGQVGRLTTGLGVAEVGLGAAGAGVGLPFGSIAAGATGAKIIGGGLDAAGEAMQHLSRSMGTGASRTGAFAALAADESASLGARTLGGIGRRFGADAILPYVGSAAAGVGIGAGVGGTLGYLSQGEEGLFGGLGGGMVLGATGGLAGRGLSHLTGGVRSQRIMGDASRAIALMPEAEGAKAQILVERFAKDGNTEAIAEVIDAKGWLGEEAPMKFLTEEEAAAMFPGQPFKGVHLDDASNTIYINVERAEPGTAFHESLHGALRTSIGKQYAKPMADALMKNLNENQLGAYIWRYVDYKGLKGKARQEAKDAFLADPLKALEEINADYFMDFLQRRENRDLLLTGKRSVDNIILGNLKNAYDSVLHKLGMSEEYKLTGRRDDPFTGHKAVDSLVRELIDARRAINKASPKTGKPNMPIDVMSPGKAVIFAREHGQTDALKYDDAGNVIGMKTEKEVIAERAEISAKVKTALKGIKNTKSFLSDEQLAVMQPLLHPEHFAKLVAMNEAVKNGTVLNGVYTPVGTKKGETTVYANRGVTERNYLPYKIKVGGKGQILIDFLDLSMLRSRADDYLSRPGKLDPWGGDKTAAIADLKRYIENLSSEKPVPSAEFFGGGEIGIQKRDILQKIYGFVRRKKWRDEGIFINENLTQKFPTPEESQPGDYMIGKQLWEKDSPRVVKSFSLERFGKITDTGEGLAFTEGKADPKTGEVITPGGYVLGQLNFQPDSFTPEKLPGGEAFVHESGYNILQKGRGKFRVYKPDGELLGLRDTMKSAASLAGRNYRKGEARFMAAAKRPVQPSLFGKEMVKDAKKKIRESKKMFPEAVPLKLKLEKDGSVKIGERVDKETGETITDVEFDQVPYGLMKAPIFPKNLSRAKSDSPVYKRAVSKGADHVVDQYNKWSGNPEITKAKGWYGKMRNWLQENFGASMEMFSQLLGATSARTGVVDNFKQARMAIRKYSQGDYDGLMGRFHDHVTETKRKADSGELFNEWKARETQKKNPAPDSAFNPLTEYRKEINKFDELPLKDNNTKYNANSMAVLKALYGNWLETTRGPKTPNFSGNLTGRTLEATIDVWAARLLRRLFYSGKRKQWRIRPEQEKGVDYNLTKGGEYTGDFPFAQRVFREAADRIGISPDDLQAIVWFGEKDVWGKEGWTGKTGKEKSSFEQEAGAMDVERFHAGVTTYRGEGFNPELFTKAKDYLRKRIGANRDLLASRVTESEGFYKKKMEPSFDTEFSTKKGADIHDIVEGVMDIGGDPRFTQDDIFISAIVSNKHPNARPSIEVGFKSPATKPQADAVMDVFIAEGVDGFTLAKDERGNVLGVRAQYVPEISARWEEGHLNYDDFLNNSAQWLSKAQKAVANLDKGAISYAEARPVSTIVYGREEYKSAPVLDPRRSDARSELGRRRHNLQTRAGLSETRVPRFQPASESGGGGSARGRGPVRPDDAGPASGVALAAQSSRFQPAESLTNGTAWRNGAGYHILQKGKRGKFRAYAPSGKLIGIYDQLKTAQKAAIRLQEKDATGKARFMPAGKSEYKVTLPDGSVETFTSTRKQPVRYIGAMKTQDGQWFMSSKHTSDPKTVSNYNANEMSRRNSFAVNENEGRRIVETKVIEVEALSLAGTSAPQPGKVKVKINRTMAARLLDEVPEFFEAEGISTASGKRGWAFEQAGGRLIFDDPATAAQAAQRLRERSQHTTSPKDVRWFADKIDKESGQ